jgi:hypothetical protein
MSDDRTGLMLDMLRAIRAKLDEHDRRFDEVITRLAAVERDFAGMKMDFAGVHVRLDNIGRRLDHSPYACFYPGRFPINGNLPGIFFTGLRQEHHIGQWLARRFPAASREFIGHDRELNHRNRELSGNVGAAATMTPTNPQRT